MSKPFQKSDRTSTGVSGLDQILCGGLLRGSVGIVQGSPGAGKTIVANQMAFAAARAGERTLYVTLLSESHGRLLRNLSTLAFFDETAIGERIRYVSGFDTLEREGAKGILRLVASEARAFQASVVIVDGLFVLGEAAESVREFRVFVNAIALQSEALGCTTLLLTNSQRQPHSAEYTMVDAWIEVCMQAHGHRIVRTVQVHKLRGSDFVAGLHSLVIGEDGVRVLPRLEALAIPDEARASARRIDAGYTRLNDVLGGGLQEGSVSLVIGPPGVGKTTLGLGLLAASSTREPGLLCGFYETPERILVKADALGLPLRDRVAENALRLVWQPATEVELDLVAHTLLADVRMRGIRRLVFDGVNGLRQAAGDQTRVAAFFAALTAALRSAGCTTLVTCEIPELLGDPGRVDVGVAPSVFDNIVLLRHTEAEGALKKSMLVIKTRDGTFIPERVEFGIGAGGIEFVAGNGRAVE